MTKGMAARAYIGQSGPCRPPPNGRQAPVALVGATGPFFCQGPRCEFEEKKLHLGPVALCGRPGDIFEIFQNGHIFLKFLFFKNIKKKKARQREGEIQTHIKQARVHLLVLHLQNYKLAGQFGRNLTFTAVVAHNLAVVVPTIHLGEHI